MKPRITWMLLLALIVGSTGCVAQKRVDDLMTINRQLESQILDLQAQLEEANARIAALQASGSESELAALMGERDQLQAALAEAEQQLRALSARSVLPPEVDSALKQLASANAELMTYDADRGMVRFNSDLTFALGSTQVNPQAAATLNQLADVINSAAAGGYEVRIVGHTDNVPVRNAANVQKFGDNWGLSAFRAIAVKDVLQSAAVEPQRMSIAGYGQFRPIATNGPKGSQANRRVEIFLVATALADETPVESAATPAPTPTPEAAVPVTPTAPSDFK